MGSAHLVRPGNRFEGYGDHIVISKGPHKHRVQEATWGTWRIMGDDNNYPPFSVAAPSTSPKACLHGPHEGNKMPKMAARVQCTVDLRPRPTTPSTKARNSRKLGYQDILLLFPRQLFTLYLTVDIVIRISFVIRVSGH